MATIREALLAALDHHASGRLDAAATLYRRIIEADGRQADAHHLLGVALAQIGRAEEALASFRTAIRLSPDQPSYRSNAANALKAAGRAGDARACCRVALALAPDHPDALGNLAAMTDDPAEALTIARRCVHLDPQKEEAPYNCGVLLRRLGRNGEALASFRRCLVLSPAHVPARHATADLLEADRPDAAALAFLRVARQAPHSPGTTLRAAAALSRSGAVDKAIALLDDLLRQAPMLPEAHFNHAGLHHESGSLGIAVAGYRRTLALAPGDAEAWYSLASVEKDRSDMGAAVAGYRRALAIQPSFQAADLELRRVLGRQFPAWHFTMLADQARNAAYQRAIDAAVKPGMIVLEIGTGAGLLALMAARAGAAHVYTCELSRPLAELARGIISDNGLADRITVINKRSSELRVGTDLPEPADLLISEILDAGLLGEGVAASVAKAARALVKPDAAILPKGAVIKAMPIECPALRSVNPVGTVAGFDLSRLEAYRNPSYMVLALNDLPHRPLGPPTDVCWIDLRNPPAHGPVGSAGLPISADGALHAIAFWFELHIDDRTVLSTAPGADSRHWQQAVQFLDCGRQVAAGETVEAGLTYIAGRLHFSA
ncbi:tetratricopeptide repeat protein [Azospirillum picis]|uniref:Tetratricopeptide (TPR) repeat protein n=1 Tax=Azospirillum picis TaxID=488438 RepID=A0ABU0MDY7_9PROT|nr:tetratricopeptide repeat protein [Azospirillum picis]MBP2297812.1 tetratricopeptide (TPR) repeat protein [Azospirillum picis]MDQ0531650.1 tetratricopeptide (TPR) repeat protein [Azospirillum picis]